MNIKRRNSLLFQSEFDRDDDNISWTSAPT